MTHPLLDRTVRSVFVTNDAISGHIGTAQVLPYLEGLQQAGHRITCISQEPLVSDWDVEGRWQQRLRAAGIGHIALRRSNRDGGRYKLERFTVPMRLARQLGILARGAERPDVIHCRAYMPLPAVLRTSSHHQIPFIFDMRAFWIDERIEGGAWKPEHPFWRQVIRRMRRIEAQAIASAGTIVTLTDDAREVIEARPDYRGAPISVIPCSVRGDIFRPLPQQRAEARARLGIAQDCRVIAYLGSTGGVYRTDAIYRLWQAMSERGTRTAILLIGDHDRARHIAAAAQVGITLDPAQVFITKLPHHEVPLALAAADIGISPRIPNFSSLGASPTKVGEYLSCGLPVITNIGIGDARRIITDGENGFVLPDFSDDSIASGADALLAGLAGGFLPGDEISRRAREVFDMRRAVASYDAIYRGFAPAP